ncbi:hypothetical protein KY495_05695 [Massilia sp. PAMC28688]|uniref:hypothetical protein n=1 Tax=Massilia sp. PAMC28688 TaxID=2861283 RepID=UPI001C63AC2E|nr:hypothetical protein [Massilia sp. PAMC28688]QYF94687.1 hypothetical protein KY495_05695 [Massilia sp. PAMC28688]
MRKLLPFIILFILAMLLWDAAVDPFHMSVNLDDADFDGPLGALMAAALAGGGLIIGIVVVAVVAVVLAVVFAGVGVVVCGALVLAALLGALALVPVMLPVLIPVALIWYLMMRDRRQRHSTAEAAPL